MNRKIMSLVIISMMMIVVLNVVFADKEECSCNHFQTDESFELKEVNKNE